MFFIAASLGAVAGAVRRTSKPKGGTKGLKFGKWYAHEMRTGNKMLFCSPRIKIATYHQPLFLLLVVGADKEEYIRQQRRPEKD